MRPCARIGCHHQAHKLAAIHPPGHPRPDTVDLCHDHYVEALRAGLLVDRLTGLRLRESEDGRAVLAERHVAPTRITLGPPPARPAASGARMSLRPDPAPKLNPKEEPMTTSDTRTQAEIILADLRAHPWSTAKEVAERTKVWSAPQRCSQLHKAGQIVATTSTPRRYALAEAQNGPRERAEASGRVKPPPSPTAPQEATEAAPRAMPEPEHTAGSEGEEVEPVATPAVVVTLDGPALPPAEVTRRVVDGRAPSDDALRRAIERLDEELAAVEAESKRIDARRSDLRAARDALARVLAA